MATQTFNDGDPIDASIIQNLVTEVNSLKSKIPQIGTPTPITLGGSTAVIPQIYAGRTDKFTITKAGKEIPIDFSSAGFTATPKAVMVLPHTSKLSNVDFIQVQTVTSTISKSGITAWATLSPSSKKNSQDCYFYFIAVSHA